MEKEVEQQPTSHKKQILISIGVMTLLVIITTLVILYGKGYRLGFQTGEPKVAKTGILQLTSLPTGAQVYIDDHPTTATNNNVNLTPGKYKVKIAKDGYNDWQKDIEIKEEEVSKADALLLPKAPNLQSISTFGVESVVVDPTGTKLAFKIASQSAKRNGVYIFDLTSRTFPVLAGQSSSTQLADDTNGILFSTAQLSWSPDGKQILASIAGELDSSYYLLKTDGLNENPQDVTTTLTGLLDTWQAQREDKEAARLKSLKPAVQKFAKDHFRILSWSPDDNKILYQASESAQMPIFTKPRLINNLLYERRDLEEGAIYVYDMKEDLNTRIIAPIDALCAENTPDCTIPTPFTWFPNSNHLIYVHDKKINMVEIDGSNMTTIYAGPFVDHYVFPWPDGSKIVILTNLNNVGVAPTLYTIGLK